MIEDVAHVRPARIGEQRTVAERAGPELHATLKPGDDLAVGDHVRSVARGGFAAPGRETGRLDRRQNFAPVERGTQIRRGVAALGRAFLLGAMHDKGGADRGARIVRRGGYEHIGEIAGLPDQLIGHAIERDAAGKAQIVERHFAFEAPDERHDRRIRGLLQRRRDIGMPRQNLHIHVPRRTQQAFYSARLGRLKADRLRVYRIVLLADAA